MIQNPIKRWLEGSNREVVNYPPIGMRTEFRPSCLIWFTSSWVMKLVQCFAKAALAALCPRRLVSANSSYTQRVQSLLAHGQSPP